MQSKTVKNQCDPTAFIPKPARVMAILQLCIGFTALLFYLSQPFMSQLFESKSRLLLLDFVLENPQRGEIPIEKEEYLSGLRIKEQQKIAAPFIERVSKSFSIVLFELPPFTRAWLLLALVVPILLLKKVEGARQTLWLLPLCIVFSALASRVEENSSQAMQIYPSEEILESYLGRPIEGSLRQQKALLEEGWQLYLIDQYLRESPSRDKTIFQEQAARGNWAFQYNLALKLSNNSYTAQSILVTFIYLLWNFWFAIVCFRATRFSIQ